MIDFARHFPDNLLRGTGNPISEKSPYLITSPDPYFYFISGLYLSEHLKYFNDTL